MTPAASGAVAFRGVTVRRGGRRLLENVTFDVPAGSRFALLGLLPDERTALLGCADGRVRPDSGSCLVFGEAPPSGLLARLRRRRFPRPDLLVLDDASAPGPAASREAAGILLSEAARRRTSVLFAPHDVSLVERFATHVGFFRGGRLVLDGSLDGVRASCRRIRYSNERTEERTEFGNELDAFDAVRVKVRGWGIDAVVSNFDEAEFERFRALEGVVGAEAEPLSLEEIYAAVAGTGG